MEFHKKLQELRKQKGLTQEELAEKLYVSRTAISKWESGRGYPNIESIKDIAKFFAVTIDELLSGDEVLKIAENDVKNKENHFLDILFGLLDVSVILLLFLPFFAQKIDGIIYEVSLFNLTHISSYLKIAYFSIVFLIIATGIVTLVLRNCSFALWTKIKRTISLVGNGVGVIIFIVGLQPYPAVILLFFSIIKVFMLIKRQ